MVNHIIWTSNAGKPNLKIEFSDSAEKHKFFTEVTTEAAKLQLDVPLINGTGNSLIIGASNYPANPCGCYISPGGKLAINFGKTPMKALILSRLGVKSEHAEMWDQHNTIFFHQTKLPGVNSQISFAPVLVSASSIPTNPQLPPVAIMPFFNSSKNTIAIKAMGEVGKATLQITFNNEGEQQLFFKKITDKAKILGLNIIPHPFEVQKPNKILIKPSNYPKEKLGCYISANKEVSLNLGDVDFRDFVLSHLGIDSGIGTKPGKGKKGSDTFYFNQKTLSLNGPELSLETKAPGKITEDDYLDSPNGKKAIQKVFTILTKPYNPLLRGPDEQTKAAWEKHMGPPDKWEHWSNMGQDWSLNTASGEVPRPNHGIVHTLKVAQLVPVIAHFLQRYSTEAKFQKMTQKDIQKAQFMMLFSVIGRENDMSWTDANHYQQAYKEAHMGVSSEHIYAQFKKNAQKEFLEYVNANKIALIPSLFSNEGELNNWAQALDTGKPGISSASGVLMAAAHDLDLMRCYDPKKFQDLKMVDLVALLGGNEEAATQLADYAHDLSAATGDRCMGYGAQQPYNKPLFTKCSFDPEECLKQIQSVPKPDPTIFAVPQI